MTLAYQTDAMEKALPATVNGFTNMTGTAENAAKLPDNIVFTRKLG